MWVINSTRLLSKNDVLLSTVSRFPYLQHVMIRVYFNALVNMMGRKAYLNLIFTFYPYILHRYFIGPFLCYEIKGRVCLSMMNRSVRLESRTQKIHRGQASFSPFQRFLQDLGLSLSTLKIVTLPQQMGQTFPFLPECARVN